jgi:hypothetical protein
VELGENMVKYIGKVAEQISSWKKGKFSQNTMKYIQILLKFHFETIEPSIGFIINQLQNFKKIEIINVRNK